MNSTATTPQKTTSKLSPELLSSGPLQAVLRDEGRPRVTPRMATVIPGNSRYPYPHFFVNEGVGGTVNYAQDKPLKLEVNLATPLKLRGKSYYFFKDNGQLSIVYRRDRTASVVVSFDEKGQASLHLVRGNRIVKTLTDPLSKTIAKTIKKNGSNPLSDGEFNKFLLDLSRSAKPVRLLPGGGDMDTLRQEYRRGERRFEYRPGIMK